MTHEFKKIIESCVRNQKRGVKNVLATVVALDGSSYRKPGVQMLIAEDGSMTGAVSGGCVEKEVLSQAQSVFLNGLPKLMAYDGRYRLGCEGVLYILLEPFGISERLQKMFITAFETRKAFVLESFFKKEEFQSWQMGTLVHFETGKTAGFSNKFEAPEDSGFCVFRQKMLPLFQMFIIGAEHDAVQLCSAASLLGWQVWVIASPKDPRTAANFPGAKEVLHISPEEVQGLDIDQETAVVLMNHNYVTDLKFLLEIIKKNAMYIGLLGATNRRNKLFDELIEQYPDIDGSLLDKIYGPAGLDIGAVTPQEIAISIISEILTVLRKKKAIPLCQKEGKIHN